MRRLVPLLTLALGACGAPPDGGDPVDTDTVPLPTDESDPPVVETDPPIVDDTDPHAYPLLDTGGASGPLDGCEDACLTWDPPAPNPDREAQPTTREEVCNAHGPRPGRCPAGTACTTSTEGWDLSHPRHAREVTPVCEAVDDDVSAFVVDLALAAAEGPVDVSLRLTLDGDPWPEGQPTLLGGAGALTLRHERTGIVRRVELPTGGDTVDVALHRGRHRVTWAPPADVTRWPVLRRGGTLLVADGGEVTVDVPARPVEVSVTLDGAPFQGVVRGGAVLVGHDQPTWAHLWFGAAPKRLVVPLGTFDLALDVATLSRGWSWRGAAPWTLSSDDTDPVLPLDVRTALVTGTVHLDGAPAPAARNDLSVVFADAGGTSHSVSVTGADTLSARVPQGTYDVGVVWEGVDGTAWHAVVEPALLIDGDLALDLDVPLQDVSLDVRVNGAPLAGGDDGVLWLRRDDGFEARLPLAPVVEGAVPAGSWHVAAGQGAGAVPRLPVILTREVDLGAEDAIDLVSHRLRVPLTLDGGPALGASATVQAIPWDLAASWPAAGPWGDATARELAWDGQADLASGALAPGHYLVLADVILGDRRGPVSLGVVDLTSGDVEAPLALRSTSVEVRLERDGAPLPEVASGEHRGVIEAAGRAHPVPGQGPAVVRVPVLRGVPVSLSWSCGEGCGLDPHDPVALWSDVAF